MQQFSELSKCKLEGPLKRKRLWKEDHDAYSDWVGNAAFDDQVITASILEQADKVRVCFYDLAGELLDESRFPWDGKIADLECAIQAKLRPEWETTSFFSDDGHIVGHDSYLKDMRRINMCQQKPDILRVEMLFNNEENGRHCAVHVHGWRYTNEDGDFDVIERLRYPMSEFLQVCAETTPEWKRAVMPRIFLETWLRVSVKRGEDREKRSCSMYHSFDEVLEVSNVPLRDRCFSKEGHWRMRASGEPELSQEPDIHIPDSSTPYRPRYFCNFSGRWSSRDLNVHEESSDRSEDNVVVATGRTWMLDPEQCTWTYWLTEFELDTDSASAPTNPEVGQIHRFPALAENVAFRFHFSNTGFSKFMSCWNEAKAP